MICRSQLVFFFSVAPKARSQDKYVTLSTKAGEHKTTWVFLPRKLSRRFPNSFHHGWSNTKSARTCKRRDFTASKQADRQSTYVCQFL